MVWKYLTLTELPGVVGDTYLRGTRSAGAAMLVVLGFAVSACTQAPEQNADTTTAVRPNIVLILADDMGYSDIGPFGGEISTPALDELAASGIRLTNFHTASSCNPTRHALISGTDYQIASTRGRPGAGRGSLVDEIVTFPSLLRDAGYHTYVAGKWDLGTEEPNWPINRGFEESFVNLLASGNHFVIGGPDPGRRASRYQENGRELTNLPEDFFTSDTFTDKLIEFIDKHHGDNVPFFAYLSFTAPHLPLQAREQDIEPYIGRYIEGWDVVRRARFERVKEMGMIPPDAELRPRNAGVRPWNELSADEQRYEDKLMAIYAGMITNMDANIGRLIGHLREIGEYDNSVVVFLSDNGAAVTDFRPDSPADVTTFRPYEIDQDAYDNSYENLGNWDSYAGPGRGWGQVSATPFRGHKGSAAEGGTRSPTIVSFPGVYPEGVIRGALGSIVDLAPTFLEIAGVESPGSRYRGRAVFSVSGRSMVPYLEGETDSIRRDGQSANIGNAFYLGRWKLAQFRPPVGTDEWRLFDLQSDPLETNDLTQAEPERFDQLRAEFDAVVGERCALIGCP